MNGKKLWLRWIFIDVMIAALLLCTYGYYQYIAISVYAVEARDTAVVESKETDFAALHPVRAGVEQFMRINPDASVQKLESFSENDGNIIADVYQIGQMREGSQQTFYVADFYVSDITYLRTGLAENTFGKNVREKPMEILKDQKGLLGISGDNYGERENNIVVRNGVWYQNELRRRDVCVLYYDGTMEIYTEESFDEEAIKEKGAWQAWSFGPRLLDGEGHALTEFRTNDYVAKIHPRSAIGYVEPGHYMFLIVDGRQEGYSEGISLAELASIFAELGCREAYNLDGGKTAVMMTQERLISHPCEGIAEEGGREMSDIIYLGKENTVS